MMRRFRFLDTVCPPSASCLFRTYLHRHPDRKHSSPDSVAPHFDLPAALPFSAAGKLYLNIGQLYSGEEADGLTTDIHGRQVFYYRERFPCFDSYDYLHEHRYYRWFLLKENGRLTRVYTADESGWLHVTEDVENLERKLTEELKKVGWVE